MNNTQLTAHQRLRAREAKLELRADQCIERAKGNLEYIKADGVKLIGSDVADNISVNSPLVAKLIYKLTGNTPVKKARKNNRSKILGPKSSYSTREDVKNTSSFLDNIKGAVLPTLYTLGSMKLLSSSLKGAGKLVRGATRRLFGFKRKRK